VLRGIGRAIALNLSLDHAVAIAHRSTAAEGLPDVILTVAGDLADPAHHKALIAAVIDRFGRLDVVINNAGFGSSSPVDDFDPAACRAMLDVNVLAPHGVLSAALPYLQAGSVVVNISSVNAVLPPGGASLLGGSKAALQLWISGVAKELGPRSIRVNAVALYAIDIDIDIGDALPPEVFGSNCA
jgi:3-oxoacyl-[acyl-carrier protein] reductase